MAFLVEGLMPVYLLDGEYPLGTTYMGLVRERNRFH
jgi:hypothetical protein